MLALIVALFWLAILVPWGIVKFRNSRSEKSIDSFHAEHEVLSRQAYSVAPARRLEDAYLYEEHSYEPTHESARARPHLTVVQDHDTYSSLESCTSWDEWERDYDYDDPRARMTAAPLTQHRYAAYASAPSPASAAPALAPHYEPEGPYGAPRLGTSMKVRRTRILMSLGLSAVVTTGLSFLIGLSLLQFLAILSWVALVVYVATALVAVALGYLDASSLLGRRITRAYPARDSYEPDVAYGEGEYDTWSQSPEYDEPEYDDDERRESRRYALG
jgi:hypothetical protein